MKDRINAALARIEQERGVRVLLAVESGSRAWGFHSPDSDYDVRFVYVEPRDWYVSVLEARDVITAMLPDSLDLSGWELRKTLRLLLKRNIELNEWLGSPITYREIPELRLELLEHTRQSFHPAAALHHYSSMAAHALAGLDESGQIKAKKLFYVLRPMLACRWIVRQRTQPPTSFLELLECGWVSPQERDWIAQLLLIKTQDQEAAPLTLSTARIDALRNEVEQHRAAVRTLAAAVSVSTPALELDTLLRRWVA